MSQQLFGPNGFINYEEDNDGNVTVLWAGKEYYCFNRNDRIGKNIGIATMSAIGVYQKTIMDIFNVGRNTITRVHSIYKRNGLQGLVGYKQGPMGLEDELRNFVIDMYKKLQGNRGYQNTILSLVKQKYEKGEFESTLSRGKLQVILKEYREEQEEIKKDIEKKKERLEGKRKKEEEKENQKQEEEQIELLKVGDDICVDRGGASVGAVFLNELDIMKHIPVTENERESKFSNRELAATYAILNAAKIITVEQGFNHLPSYEMGGIIGRNKLPSLRTFRDRIPQIVEQMDMRDVIYETSKQVREILPFSLIVYIDGHFMPYHGWSDILYGYYPQKRLAMHGREYYFVHDEHGIPVYAEISDGYRDMRYFIRHIDEKLRGIYGVGTKELLEIFDRGGYSKEHCVEISDFINFLCWRSDAKQIPKAAQSAKWQKVELRHQGNTIHSRKDPKTYYAWERKSKFKVEEKEAVFREVWIRKGDKVSPALTNDFRLPLEEVVKKLTGRWGEQENPMKKLKAHGIDRIHSYEKEEYDEEYFYARGLEDPDKGVVYEVDNPESKRIEKEISKLLKQRRYISDRIIVLEERDDKRSKTQSREKRKELREVNVRIDGLRAEKKSIPAKKAFFERIEDESTQRLADQKKLYYDWLKMAALWTRQGIIETVKPHYENLRDIEKYVDSILNGRTYMRNQDGVLHIEFAKQHSRKKGEVLLHLCNELNKASEIDLGLKVNRLVFDVRHYD